MPRRRAALTLAAACLAAAPAAAAPSPWLPSEDERRGADERALEQAVERVLRAEAGVEQARVLVRLPRAAELALDARLPPAEVAVWLAERPGAPSDGELASLIAAAGLERASLRVTRRAQRVASLTEGASRDPLRPWWMRVVLALSLTANVILATATLLRWPKGRPELPPRSKES